MMSLRYEGCVKNGYGDINFILKGHLLEDVKRIYY